MSEGWKVAAIFFGTVGGAAIIFQLNKGTLATGFFSFITSAIGDAFSGSSSTSSTSTTSTATPQNANASPALSAKNHSTGTFGQA